MSKGNVSTLATSILGVQFMPPSWFAPFNMWFTFPGLICTAFIVGFVVEILEVELRIKKLKRNGMGS